MKIVIVSSYPPQADGIAVFTADLKQALDKEMGATLPVIAVTREQSLQYGPEVCGTIRADDADSYVQAAAAVNSQYECVLLQHEYGLFGGGGSYAGTHILEFARALTIPLVTVFHSALDHPDETKAAITSELIDRSATVIVMSRAAQAILERHYPNAIGKLTVIPHGVPVALLGDKTEAKATLDANDRYTVMTFGLLRPSKGIELGIEAIARVVATIPDILYWIIGREDSSTKRITGRDYLQELQKLVEDKHLSKNIRFVSRFVDEDELAQYFSATDVYMMLHQKRDQVSSGTLARAIGNEIPIIATATPLVQELFATGGGIAVSYGNPDEIARAIIELQDPLRRQTQSSKLSEIAKTQRWPVIAREYAKLLQAIAGEPHA